MDNILKKLHPYVTVSEVADLLRVSKMTVYRLIESGDLRSLSVGHTKRIKREDLAAYLDSIYR